MSVSSRLLNTEKVIMAIERLSVDQISSETREPIESYW
jgi:hypothetical protein